MRTHRPARWLTTISRSSPEARPNMSQPETTHRWNGRGARICKSALLLGMLAVVATNQHGYFVAVWGFVTGALCAIYILWEVA
jgi:hypothetical protein